MATKQLLLYLLCALAFTAVEQATEVRESRPIALVKPTSSIVYTDRANNTNDTCGKTQTVLSGQNVIQEIVCAVRIYQNH